MLHVKQDGMSRDTKGLSRNGVGCLTSLEPKGCVARDTTDCLEKTCCFFEGPGSQAEERGLYAVGVESPDVLDD